MVTPEPGADLVVTGAKLLATCDDGHRELAGGWVAVTGGLVSAVGGAGDPRPAARETLDASGCLVTPGLINTHHHMYQNLTRSYAPTVNGTLFEWLSGLYPLWARLDEESSYLSAWVALAELALAQAELGPAAFGRLMDANALDLELYQFAQRRFTEQMAARQTGSPELRGCGSSESCRVDIDSPHTRH